MVASPIKKGPSRPAAHLSPREVAKPADQLTRYELWVDTTKYHPTKTTTDQVESTAIRMCGKTIVYTWGGGGELGQRTGMAVPARH